MVLGALQRLRAGVGQGARRHVLGRHLSSRDIAAGPDAAALEAVARRVGKGVCGRVGKGVCRRIGKGVRLRECRGRGSIDRGDAGGGRMRPAVQVGQAIGVRRGFASALVVDDAAPPVRSVGLLSLMVLVLVARNADGQDGLSAWRLRSCHVKAFMLMMMIVVLVVVVLARVSCVAGLHWAGAEHAVVSFCSMSVACCLSASRPPKNVSRRWGCQWRVDML